MYENARIIIVGLWFVPLCSFVMLLFLAVCSGPSISGSDERGAEAALPPSTPANAVTVSNSVVGAKLGDGQALRVRLDSYPAGKWYLFHFCIKNWILSSKHFCRIRTKQDWNTSWTEGNKHFALARHSPIPLWNPCSLPKSTISGKYFCFACLLFCVFSTWTMLLPMWPPLPLPPPLLYPYWAISQEKHGSICQGLQLVEYSSNRTLAYIGVTKKKLSYFCLQRTTCITQENEARNLNTSIRSQMIFGILEHMKLKS